MVGWMMLVGPACTGVPSPTPTQAPPPIPADPAPLVPVQAVTNPTRATTVRGLVPPTYKVVMSERGDLDLDGNHDTVLIVESTVDNPDGKREVWLAMEHEGGATIGARNTEAAYCRTCGGVFGDPLAGITIAKGYFSIEHYGGSNFRWVRIFTFKHVGDHWELSRDGEENFHTSEPDKVERSARTPKDFGVIRFEDFTVP